MRVNYRKIYEDKCGPIPVDEHGCPFEIHHIDGDRSNNNISNLKAVSLKEHYDIHYAQKDYAACWYIARKMKIPHDEWCELIRAKVLEQVHNGTHHWTKPEHKANAKKVALRRLRNGTHNFQQEGYQSKLARKRYDEGTHNFIKMSQKIHTCPHCGKKGKGSPMFRWHFDRCRNGR